MPDSPESVESILTVLKERIERYDPTWLDGALQFELTGAADESWFLGPDPDAGLLCVRAGRHPGPRWTLTTNARALVDLATGRLSLRDPAQLSALRIRGDVFDLGLKLGPFIGEMEDPEQVFGFREAFARSHPVAAVHHLAEVSVEAIEWAAEQAVPTLFARGLSSWPCWSWTVESLIDRCRDVAYFDFSTFEHTTLAAFLRKLTAGSSRNRQGGLALPKELGAELRRSDLPLLASDGQVFCAGAGSITPLHRDGIDMLSLQVFGTKRWVYYSPDQAPDLYPAPIQDGFQNTLVNIDKPDLARFPGFARARPIEVIVPPGACLFNPAGWFHQVYAQDLALSLTFSLGYACRIPRGTPPG